MPAQDVPHSLSHTLILNIAEDIFAKNGYEGVKVRTLAQQLNCSVGSIYRYYPTKHDLLEAMCMRLLNSVVTHAETGDSIELSAMRYAKAAHAKPNVYQLLFWLPHTSKANTPNSLPLIVNRLLKAWQVPCGSFEQALHQWCILHGLLLAGLPIEEATAHTRSTRKIKISLPAIRTQKNRL